MKVIQNFLQEAPQVIDDVGKALKNEVDDIIQLKKKSLSGGIEKLPAIKKQAKNMVDDLYRTVKDKTDQLKAKVGSDKKEKK